MSTVPGQPAEQAHVASYVPSRKYPNLVSLVCSCGRSSYGACRRDSAERDFEEHRANPWDGRLRDRDTTALLFDLSDPLNPKRKGLL